MTRCWASWGASMRPSGPQLRLQLLGVRQALRDDACIRMASATLSKEVSCARVVLLHRCLHAVSMPDSHVRPPQSWKIACWQVWETAPSYEISCICWIDMQHLIILDGRACPKCAVTSAVCLIRGILRLLLPLSLATAARQHHFMATEIVVLCRLLGHQELQHGYSTHSCTADQVHLLAAWSSGM